MMDMARRAAETLGLANPSAKLGLTGRQRRNFYAGWALVPPATTFCSIKVIELVMLAAQGTPTGATTKVEYLAAWAMVAALYPRTMKLLLGMQDKRRRRLAAQEPEEVPARETGRKPD